jgi:hypothetical protein
MFVNKKYFIKNNYLSKLYLNQKGGSEVLVCAIDIKQKDKSIQFVNFIEKLKEFSTNNSSGILYEIKNLIENLNNKTFVFIGETLIAIQENFDIDFYNKLIKNIIDELNIKKKPEELQLDTTLLKLKKSQMQKVMINMLNDIYPDHEKLVIKINDFLDKDGKKINEDIELNLSKIEELLSTDKYNEIKINIEKIKEKITPNIEKIFKDLYINKDTFKNINLYDIDIIDDLTKLNLKKIDSLTIAVLLNTSINNANSFLQKPRWASLAIDDFSKLIDLKTFLGLNKPHEYKQLNNDLQAIDINTGFDYNNKSDDEYIHVISGYEDSEEQNIKIMEEIDWTDAPDEDLNTSKTLVKYKREKTKGKLVKPDYFKLSVTQLDNFIKNNKNLLLKYDSDLISYFFGLPINYINMLLDRGPPRINLKDNNNNITDQNKKINYFNLSTNVWDDADFLKNSMNENLYNTYRPNRQKHIPLKNTQLIDLNILFNKKLKTKIEYFNSLIISAVLEKSINDVNFYLGCHSRVNEAFTIKQKEKTLELIDIFDYLEKIENGKFIFLKYECKLTLNEPMWKNFKYSDSTDIPMYQDLNELDIKDLLDIDKQIVNELLEKKKNNLINLELKKNELDKYSSLIIAVVFNKSIDYINTIFNRNPERNEIIDKDNSDFKNELIVLKFLIDKNNKINLSKNKIEYLIENKFPFKIEDYTIPVEILDFTSSAIAIVLSMSIAEINKQIETYKKNNSNGCKHIFINSKNEEFYYLEDSVINPDEINFNIEKLPKKYKNTSEFLNRRKNKDTTEINNQRELINAFTFNKYDEYKNILEYDNLSIAIAINKSINDVKEIKKKKKIKFNLDLNRMYKKFIKKLMRN